MTKLRGKKHTPWRLFWYVLRVFFFGWQIFAIFQKKKKNMLSQIPFFFGEKKKKKSSENERKKSQKICQKSSQLLTM
jgi:hypothetical protein